MYKDKHFVCLCVNTCVCVYSGHLLWYFTFIQVSLILDFISSTFTTTHSLNYLFILHPDIPNFHFHIVKWNAGHSNPLPLFSLLANIDSL